jgi:hypothetical protein
MIESSQHARRAVEKVLGKQIREETLTSFEARLLAAVVAEVEKAILLERQGVAQIVLSALERARLAEATGHRDEWPGAISALDDVRVKIDRRTVADAASIEKLACGLMHAFQSNGILGLNEIADTSYETFVEAARELALGQAPIGLEDDARVWPVLVEAWRRT